MNRREYVLMMAPIAMQLRMEGSFMFPSVLIAQTILETGGTVPFWNNVLGIKGSPKHATTPYWDGRIVHTKTREVYDGVNYPNVTAGWRMYDSVEDCLRDHARMIEVSSYYDQTRAAPTAIDQCVALYRDGYATDAPREVDGDPAYYEKLISIIQFHGLAAYDVEVEMIMTQLQERMSQLEDVITSLTDDLAAARSRIKDLEGKTSMPVPEWAQQAVSAAVAKGIIDSPDGGSYDFYRLLTILHRMNLDLL